MSMWRGGSFRLPPITLLCVVASLAAPAAGFGQEPEPEEPEPISDFWSEYLPPEEPAAPAADPTTTPASEPAPAPSPAHSGSSAPRPTSTDGSRPAQVTQGDSYCDPRLVLRQTGGAAARALARRPLIGHARRSLVVRARSCAGGRLEIRLVDATAATTVAVAKRSVRANVPAKLTLRQTTAGLRWERRLVAGAKRRYALRLDVRFVPGT